MLLLSLPEIQRDQACINHEITQFLCIRFIRSEFISVCNTICIQLGCDPPGYAQLLHRVHH